MDAALVMLSRNCNMRIPLLLAQCNYQRKNVTKSSTLNEDYSKSYFIHLHLLVSLRVHTLLKFLWAVVVDHSLLGKNEMGVQLTCTA